MIAGHRRNRARRAGATLIELIIALVMLTVGLLPLLLAMNRIFADTFASGTRSEAQLLCAEKIDELKARGFLDLETDYLTGVESAIINEGALSQKPYYRQTQLVYQYQAADTRFVDATLAQSPTDFLKITTTVNWTMEKRSVTRNLVTMVTREGAFE